MFPPGKRAKMNAENTEPETEAEATASMASKQSNSVSSGVIATGVPASVTVALHPLIIMNVSEHYTRVKAQLDLSNPHVIGAILGRRTGRHLELFNSFELQYTTIEETAVIDMDYFRSKEEQFHQVFKDLDFLGWYTVGGVDCSHASERDVAIHRQLIEVNETSLFLKLDPLSKSSNLPVTIYESVIDIIDQQPRMLFIEVTYTLVTEEAERIGVDHVSRLSSGGDANTSEVADHIQVQRSAVLMLHKRIKIILEYIKAVQDGEVPLDHSVMRDCVSLCQRLPVLNTDQFRASFFEQCNDVTLMALLATITKGCNQANELIKKFNLTYDRQGSGRRMRPLFL